MLNKISDHIYYFSNQDEMERPTLGLVCGNKYSLLVDAGNSVQHARDFLEEIVKLDVPPVKYVVITHAHWDHFLGMNEFDATVVTNGRTREALREWQGYKFDDASLQSYVSNNKMNTLCKEIIQAEIPNRSSFKLGSPDIIFEDRLTIDLGDKFCQLERITSTHTNDSTIVYIPDEKVLFLGDSAYGTTTDAMFHFKQSLLLPMIEEIQKYDAQWFLLGHESICDQEEMELYWSELQAASNAVETASLDNSIERFYKENKREPNENERFFIKAFVNDQILRSKNKDKNK